MTIKHKQHTINPLKKINNKIKNVAMKKRINYTLLYIVVIFILFAN